MNDSGRLSRRVAKELNNLENEIWLSPISVWEAMFLHRKGRLKVREGFSTWLRRALMVAPFKEAPFTFDVAEALAGINLPHSDPADLFLAGSAKVFGLTLITADRNLIRAKEISIMEN